LLELFHSDVTLVVGDSSTNTNTINKGLDTVSEKVTQK
ncbi:uncharacterized protein Dwil_GK26777, partial [Drosophila willistoni]